MQISATIVDDLTTIQPEETSESTATKVSEGRERREKSKKREKKIRESTLYEDKQLLN